MSKSENNRRQGTTPPSRRRRSSAPSSSPRKRVSPSKDHISGKESIGSKKSGKSRKSKTSTASPEGIDFGSMFSGLPGGEFTLMDIPTRKPLPELAKRPGRSCLLVEIVKYNPNLYKRMLGFIVYKVSANLAAIKVGINESTFWDWSYRGKADAERGEDTYFARFNEDIRRAAASAAVDAEMELNSKSPERYLNHGLGRIFGIGKQKNRREIGNSGGQKALPSPAQTMEDVIDGAFTVISRQPPEDEFETELVSGDEVRLSQGGGGRGREGANDGRSSKSNGSALQPQTGQTLSLTAEQEYGALSVWDDMGLISLSPELKQAFSEQSSK